jgi:hypothetical protein
MSNFQDSQNFQKTYSDHGKCSGCGDYDITCLCNTCLTCKKSHCSDCISKNPSELGIYSFGKGICSKCCSKIRRKSGVVN